MTKDKRDTGNRPGLRGPGLTKPSKGPQKSKGPNAKDSKASNPSAIEESRVPAELQQQILNIYKRAFPNLVEGGADALKPLLQEVKQALFERDFERAFGRQDYLEAYAFRWSPSRALCYVSILADLENELRDTLLFRSIVHEKCSKPEEPVTEDGDLDNPSPQVHVACLGGGAAEVVAFSGLLKHLIRKSKSPPIQTEAEDFTTDALEATTTTAVTQPQVQAFRLLLLDTAAWAPVISTLSTTLTTPATLSPYASFSAQLSNRPFLPPGTLTTTFQRSDLLSLSISQLKDILGATDEPLLITLLFTLNELYTTSIAQTTAFLLNLTAATARGMMLLVVDSPGSYSEAAVGKDLKKYPMQWLMDRTLLGERRSGAPGDEDGKPEWEKRVGDESKWFRIREELKYPIPLENMRYQIHLYQRI